MTTHDIAKTERVEMYLKAVYVVQQAAPPVTVSKVAEFMGVATPSAWEMLRRLEHQGLVRGAGEDGFHLTPAGLQRATKVVRRLRLAERLLTDVLRLDLAKVYDEACKMEHVISEEVEARLADVLGHPGTCPHGLPIPGENAEPLPPYTLLDLAPGQAGRVAAVPEQDSAMVAYLASLRLVPGETVAVEEVAPFNGPLTVAVGGRRQAIGREVAARVRVHLQGPSP
jgi:DtxR family Mn-dependent transcriptional regulator